MSGIKEQDLIGTTGVTTPRFDDERTIQSARRVVPLNKIGSRPRQKFYGLGVCLLIISLAAVFAVRLAGEETKVAPEALSAAGGIIEQPSAGESVSVTEEAPIELSTEPVTTQKASAVSAAQRREVKQQVVSATSSNPPVRPKKPILQISVPPSRAATAVPQEVLPDLRPAEPVAQSQHQQTRLEPWERRQRRVERRNRAQALDGAFRIEDIFKGRRRP
jgi:hypothetical protein